MKGLLAVSLVSIILLAGCTKSYEAPGESAPLATGEGPQITSTPTVEVTRANETIGAKAYHVNIGQGVGVREGSG